MVETGLLQTWALGALLPLSADTLTPGPHRVNKGRCAEGRGGGREVAAAGALSALLAPSPRPAEAPPLGTAPQLQAALAPAAWGAGRPSGRMDGAAVGTVPGWRAGPRAQR